MNFSRHFCFNFLKKFLVKSHCTEKNLKSPFMLAKHFFPLNNKGLSGLKSRIVPKQPKGGPLFSPLLLHLKKFSSLQDSNPRALLFVSQTSSSRLQEIRVNPGTWIRVLPAT